MAHIVTEEVRYRLLTRLAEHPDASQRQLSRELGISLGKVNYCLRALMKRGLVKARNFKNSENKWAYAYILTRKGLEEKMNVTCAFLRRRIDEYATLAREIERLRAEVGSMTSVEKEK